MREFDLNGRTFGTIIVAMNSALHLHNLDDFKGFFQSVARHLSCHGRLVFDVFVPSVAFLNSDPDKRQFLGRVTHDSLGHVTVEENCQVRFDYSDQPYKLVLVDGRREGFLGYAFADASDIPSGDAASGGVRRLTPDRAFRRFRSLSTTAASRRQVCVCAPA